MKVFHKFYNMKAGVIDLAKLSVEIIPLDDELLSERIGGAAVNMALFDQYGQDDPIILGVGPLTGSFAPASCLMTATFRSPKSGKMTHVPFMFRTGPEMKFAGFDYLVIMGSAEQPQLLVFTEGTADFLPAGHMTGLKIPENMRALKRERRHTRSAVLTGPAADKGLSYASASVGVGGSLDKTGLAPLMAAKNLKGFMFRGIDGLPFGENNLALGDEMIKGLAVGGKANRGFLSVLEKFGTGNAAIGSLRNYRMKNMACYHCPSPCMSHVTVVMPKALYVQEPPEKVGMFLLDHLGYGALAAKRRADMVPVMASCLHLGLDPLAASGRLPDEGTPGELISALESMIAESRPVDGETEATYGEVFGNVTEDSMRRFGGGLVPLLISDGENPIDLWQERVATAMILGVCPLFLTRFPEIGIEKFLSFMAAGEDGAKDLRESIAASVQLVCGR